MEKVLECCKVSSLRDSDQRSETKMLIGMWTVKERPRNFRLGTRAPLAVMLEVIYVILY